MALGMTQAQLADRIGVTRPHMNVIEHDGVAQPSLPTMQALERVLGPVRRERQLLEEALAQPPEHSLADIHFLDVNDLRAGLSEVVLFGELSNAGIAPMTAEERVLCITERAPDASKREVLVRVNDESLTEWNIRPGDYAIVRLCDAADVATGDVVIVTVNGQPFVKRWMWRAGKRMLESEGSDGVRFIKPTDAVTVIGVLHRSFPLQFHSRAAHLLAGMLLGALLLGIAVHFQAFA